MKSANVAYIVKRMVTIEEITRINFKEVTLK